jgi:hypothetical protein
MGIDNRVAEFLERIEALDLEIKNIRLDASEAGQGNASRAGNRLW